MKTWEGLLLVLNAKQAAEVLGVNERTVRNWITAGKLPAATVVQVWMIRR